MARFNRAIKTFDVSVFNGCYVTGDISPDYLEMLEMTRNDKKKSISDPNNEVIGLFNNYGV